MINHDTPVEELVGTEAERKLPSRDSTAILTLAPGARLRLSQLMILLMVEAGERAYGCISLVVHRRNQVYLQSVDLSSIVPAGGKIDSPFLLRGQSFQQVALQDGKLDVKALTGLVVFVQVHPDPGKAARVGGRDFFALLRCSSPIE